jgi:hypothetical protein
VDAEHAVGGGVGQHLHEAVRARMARARPLAVKGTCRLVGDAGGLQLFLGLADGGDFGLV